MISNAVSPSAVAISSTSGAILPASFRTGTTTATAGGKSRISFMICPCGRGAAGVQDVRSFLWGGEPAGNPLDAPPGGAGQRPNRAIGCDREAEAARGEPIAHDERADRARNRPGDHVAED